MQLWLFSEGFSDNRLQNYQQLKQKYRAAGNDFETLTRIANLIFTLSDEYQVTYQYTHRRHGKYYCSRTLIHT